MNRCAHRETNRNPQAGFTLVEVIVVLSVILLLTGIAVPMLSSYLDDGRRARAQAEVKVVAAAMMQLNKDIGTYPARNGSGANNYLYCMYTGPDALASNQWTGSHTWITWALDAQRGDQLDNHLLQNLPQGAVAGAYSLAGNMRWRGPYSAGPTPLDPWGRPYLVNVLCSYRTDVTNYKRMWVMSAGPDGQFSTNYLARSTDDIAGDDIGFLVMQRQ